MESGEVNFQFSTSEDDKDFLLNHKYRINQFGYLFNNHHKSRYYGVAVPSTCENTKPISLNGYKSSIFVSSCIEFPLKQSGLQSQKESLLTA